MPSDCLNHLSGLVQCQFQGSVTTAPFNTIVKNRQLVESGRFPLPSQLEP